MTSRLDYSDALAPREPSSDDVRTGPIGDASASEDLRKCPIGDGASSEDVRKCPTPCDQRLDEKQHAAIEFLLLGKTFGAVARSLEVDVRTLYRWRQDRVFAAALARRRRELWAGAAERLRGLIHPAIDVLEQHLTDRYDRARFRGATAILRLSDIRKAVAKLDADDQGDADESHL